MKKKKQKPNLQQAKRSRKDKRAKREIAKTRVITENYILKETNKDFILINDQGASVNIGFFEMDAILDGYFNKVLF